MDYLLFLCTPPVVADTSEFVKFYAENLRGNLFSGFLTLAGFLLSAKTFIVIHLQKEIYAKRHYHDRIRDLRKIDSTLKYYAPLRNLSRLLFWTILTSLLAAIAQVTIGLISHACAVWLCVILAITAIVFLFVSFCVMSASLRDWFNFLEDEAEKEQEAGGQPTEEGSADSSAT
jgi:hypothetical protein